MYLKPMTRSQALGMDGHGLTGWLWCSKIMHRLLQHDIYIDT